MEDSVLVKWAHNLLVQVGIEPETAHLLDQFVIIAMILLCALAADVICRFVILAVGRRIIVRTKKRWGELLFNRDVLRKFSNIVPVALIYILIPLAFPEHSETPVLLRKICLLYVIFVVVMFVNMLLKVFFGILEQKETLHDRPLKGLLQILQVGLFFLAAIVVTSLLIGRSPLKLLAGLGASAAILMLIFKDTIMGFVAGVMLSANKMLRPGDWISMPKYNVDGTVLEVTLNTVKIQNFDNTVTTVPPFILTGDSFQNWRWMQESGGRRIMRSINIDLGSVRFCTPEMTEKYKDIELLHDYVVQRETEFDRYRNGAENPNGADFFRLTNLTVFRAYLNLYLKKLAVVNHELTCMVRHLQPTPNGIPVEVYCFSVIKEWVAYESVQADLFDHIIAVVPEFDLVLFQRRVSGDNFCYFPFYRPFASDPSLGRCGGRRFSAKRRARYVRKWIFGSADGIRGAAAGRCSKAAAAEPDVPAERRDGCPAFADAEGAGGVRPGAEVWARAGGAAHRAGSKTSRGGKREAEPVPDDGARSMRSSTDCIRGTCRG